MPPIIAVAIIMAKLFVILKLISAGMTVEQNPIENAQLKEIVSFE
jgi:hypothetical protein